MNGNQITTLSELDLARTMRLCVIVPGTVFNKPRPAAFVMNLQGYIIYRLLLKGMFVYVKEPKPEGPKPMTWQLKGKSCQKN